MQQLKKTIKNISPFNNRNEISTPIYILKKILAFLTVYSMATVLAEAIIIGLLYATGYDPLHGIIPTGNFGILLPYYGFLIYLLVAILYCRFVEKRTLQSMGFNKCIMDYLYGAVISIFLLIFIIGICFATGKISFIGFYENVDIIYIFALLVGFIIQSAAEEALCRGFLLLSLLKKTSVSLAVILSSSAFALPHLFSLFEADWIFAIIGIINLYLISAIFSLLALCRSNIWISCGLHGFWNFLVSGVLGLTLSGGDSTTSCILLFNVESSDLFTGGAYGIEASIITTIVLTLALIILIRYWRKYKNEF